MQTVASAALQEAYDDLAVRFNQLEIENAKQQMQLVSQGLPRKLNSRQKAALTDTGLAAVLGSQSTLQQHVDRHLGGGSPLITTLRVCVCCACHGRRPIRRR
jgi:hypothetical protein